MKYKAFISYRRENGFYLARLVRDQLEKRNISAFLDLEELRSGEFNKKLYDAIGSSENFILVLPPNSLDRCVNDEDWVRKEIMAAIEMKRNIIPILGEGFEWPRKENCLDYEQLPAEIRNLENFSGVKASKDYLDAMIDRLISFMIGVHPENNMEADNDYASTNEYFKNGLKDIQSVMGVDMAFHAGAEWFSDIEKNDILYGLIEGNNNLKLKVLLNSQHSAEQIAKHMRHPRKSYIQFSECIHKWNEFAEEFPSQVEVRISDIPILRRYYSFHMTETSSDTVNVKYYTYGNANPDKNYQPIFYHNSKYYDLYSKEFEYLWARANKNIIKGIDELKDDEEKNSSQIDKMNTVTFFRHYLDRFKNTSMVDMCFRAGSEWHLKSSSVELLSYMLDRGIKFRIIINEQSVVEETAFYMKQPLKKYYGYDKSLSDWIELTNAYPEQIFVRAANVPLMRRYYHIRDSKTGIVKISCYTYGNSNLEKDFQSVIDSTDEYYDLYTEEFEYLWYRGSHEIL